ncbi:ABC transporter permease [Flavobacteriales bacterium]|nr:ABC transporter permease [Flavobacteriales bacterium]
MKINSINKIIWKKFKDRTSSLLALFFIALCCFLAIFTYQIIPDKTPMANEMNLELATLPPFSKVQFLSTDILCSQSPNSIKSFFFGKLNNCKMIPVQSFSEIKDGCIYTKYNSLVEYKFIGEYKFETRNFWLGTDKFGRDFFSRLIYGIRVSLSIGLVAVFISVLIGLTLGLLAGYFRGRTDDIIMWFINVVWSIPTLLMVIAITLALGKGFWQVFIAVGLTMWVEVARIVRGQVLAVRELEYVQAAQVLGFKSFRILKQHVLPNIIGPVIVISAANFASAILIEAGLSFLGIGAQPPFPSWGGIIKDHYSYIVMNKAYLAIFPGVAIMLLVLSFMILGNGIRDAFDVKY